MEGARKGLESLSETAIETVVGIGDSFRHGVDVAAHSATAKVESTNAPSNETAKGLIHGIGGEKSGPEEYLENASGRTEDVRGSLGQRLELMGHSLDPTKKPSE